MLDKEEVIIKIAVIAGTTRVQRKSFEAAKLIAEIGKTLDNVEITLIDPMDFKFPGDGDDPEAKDPRYSKITLESDAFFIITPEYNHSFPGSLKRMLDSELKNYIHKPVALAGASSGNWGGVRAVESLVNAVREMGLVATYTDVYFPHVGDSFVDGVLRPELVEITHKSIHAAYGELLWMAKALKQAREAKG
jgi:NAD(P)H-dependent FMN reductase